MQCPRDGTALANPKRLLPRGGVSTCSQRMDEGSRARGNGHDVPRLGDGICSRLGRLRDTGGCHGGTGAAGDREGRRGGVSAADATARCTPPLAPVRTGRRGAAAAAEAPVRGRGAGVLRGDARPTGGGRRRRGAAGSGARAGDGPADPAGGDAGALASALHRGRRWCPALPALWPAAAGTAATAPRAMDAVPALRQPVLRQVPQCLGPRRRSGGGAGRGRASSAATVSAGRWPCRRGRPARRRRRWPRKDSRRPERMSFGAVRVSASDSSCLASRRAGASWAIPAGWPPARGRS